MIFRLPFATLARIGRCPGRAATFALVALGLGAFTYVTRGGWRETPQDHRVGVFDVRQLSDEELERMIIEHQRAIADQSAIIR